MSSYTRSLWAVPHAAFLLLLLASGCTTWKSQATPPEQIVAEKPKTSLRITTPDCAPFEICGIQVVRDSLFGDLRRRPKAFPEAWTLSKGWSNFTRDYSFHAAVPLASVTKVEVAQTDAVKTTVLLVAIGATLVAVIALASVNTEPGGGGGEYNSGAYSCPLILSSDGEVWRLDSGSYAGAIMPALARSDIDNLEHAVAKDGIVRLRLTGLSGEMEHVDALALLAVDHDPDVSVVPDGRGGLHTLGKLASPTRVHDFFGRDASNRVTALDEWCWESALVERDPAADSGLRDGLEIEFAKPPGARTAKLVVDGTNTAWAMHVLQQMVSLHGQSTQAWYDAVSADTAKAAQIKTAFAREAFLGVSVWGPDGWERQGAVWESGPEILKRQVVVLDVSRTVGETVRVRLDSTPNFWLVDRVAIDFSSDRPLHATEVDMATARDLRGRDVRRLLSSQDSEEYAIAPGDTAEIAFRVPATRSGQKRTYLARTTGWYRMNTPEIGEPQTALLDRLETEKFAAARYAVERMNEMLAVAAQEPSE